MDHLEIPRPEVWGARREWYESHIFHYEELGSYLVGEQACALISDTQACFCSGAWASVIVISFAVIEAHIRETNPDSSKKQSHALLEERGFGERVQSLRKLRNSLVHAKRDAPALTMDQQWDEREKLEVLAKEAVSIMFEIFYSEPGT
ncbi:hypothetical protein PSCICN_31390 [Pseudomonas cichorii]|uniref:hypothetical protein n=1 Tax=Pseudomonas cichorii TaxID=36746 RepID=UPI001910BED0|nr:hypothetical protein [Pseudomonas cichorii]GFM82447.1 hypothetical protein PSCICN_31390 [Pseudomonas cichorii]